MNAISGLPLLMSAPMVCATLDLSKTQTRRVVKSELAQKYPEFTGIKVGLGYPASENHLYAGFKMAGMVSPIYVKCPYGKPGDQLWVKETFYAFGKWETSYSKKKGRDEWHFIDMTIECGLAYLYAADNPGIASSKGRGALPGWYKRPAIFMPRKASRITLEIVSVRVERLNDISEEDAKAEGVNKDMPKPIGQTEITGIKFPWSYHIGFSWLWESINGAGSCAQNPLVWAIEFKKIN